MVFLMVACSQQLTGTAVVREEKDTGAATTGTQHPDADTAHTGAPVDTGDSGQDTAPLYNGRDSGDTGDTGDTAEE